MTTTPLIISCPVKNRPAGQNLFPQSSPLTQTSGDTLFADLDDYRNGVTSTVFDFTSVGTTPYFQGIKTAKELGEAVPVFVDQEDESPFNMDQIYIGGALSVVASEGVLSRPITWKNPLTRTGGPGPQGASGSIPVSVVGTVGMYVGLDKINEELGVPDELRGVVNFVEMPLAYQALYETDKLFKAGLLQRPQWGKVAASTPLFSAASMGASILLDQIPGLEMGTVPNQLISFAASTYLYYKIPQSAAMKSAMGIGLKGAEGSRVFLAKGVAGGAGRLGGALQAFGAVGAVSLGDFVGSTAFDITMWATGTSSDPDYQIQKIAYDSVMREQAGKVGMGFFGGIIRGLQSIAGYVSDDFEETMDQAIRDRIDLWIAECRDFAKALENDMLPIFVASLSEDSTIDWFKLHMNIFGVYNSNPQGVEYAYSLLDMIVPTSYGWDQRLDLAKTFSRMIPMDGNLTNRDAMRGYLKGKVKEWIDSGRLKTLVKELRAKEKYNLRERGDELGLNSRDEIPEEEMTDEQRTFWYGDGTTSELEQRLASIERLETLLNALETDPERFAESVVP